MSWDATDTLNIWLSYATDIRDTKTSGVNKGGYLISDYRPDLLTQDGFLLSEQYQWDKENPAVKDPYKVDMGLYLDNVTLKYVGSYFDGNNTQENGDVGFTSNPDNRVVEGVEQNSESYSHELQFISAGDGPLQWVGGLYYYHGETEQPFSINSKLADYLDYAIPEDEISLFDPSTAIPNPNRAQYSQTTDLDTDSYAI